MAACEDDSEVLAWMGVGDVSSCLNLARSDESDFVTSNLQGVSLHNFEIGVAACDPLFRIAIHMGKPTNLPITTISSIAKKN